MVGGCADEEEQEYISRAEQRDLHLAAPQLASASLLSHHHGLRRKMGNGDPGGIRRLLQAAG